MRKRVPERLTEPEMLFSQDKGLQSPRLGRSGLQSQHHVSQPRGPG